MLDYVAQRLPRHLLYSLILIGCSVSTLCLKKHCRTGALFLSFRMEDETTCAIVQTFTAIDELLEKEQAFRVAQETPIKILSDNRSAGHNYHLMDRYEAGLVLTGTEVKSAKSGKIQLKESYAEVEGSEAWLMNAHISEYSHGNIMNHAPVRKRKLLLHRSEIEKLQTATREKGLTLVPTRLYL